MKPRMNTNEHENYIKGQTVVLALIGCVIGLLLLYGIWLWGFCRFYISPGHMAIITSKAGKPLPEGEILAEKGQKGVWEDVLGEGRYFFNPILYDWEIRKMIYITAGKIGVVTSKIGKDLPQGEFLADSGQKGIEKKVLGPGLYRLNPYGYEVNIQDALEIPIGYAGVVTSLSGKGVKEGGFAEIGEKGVLENILQPGLYYINPKQYKVDILEVGTNQISLLGSKGPLSFAEEKGRIVRTKEYGQLRGQMVVESKAVKEKFQRNEEKRREYSMALQQQAVQQPAGFMKTPVQPEAAPSLTPVIQFIEFPSKDGFDIRLDMTVEFEFLPKNIARISMNYGDLFQVVEKIILPQILSISRLTGSAYGARDFIVGEGREKFQENLTTKLEETLGAKGIVVLSALIRHVIVPDEIRKPIQDASIAIERNLTNIEKQGTAKKLAELNTELSLIAQRSEQVQQETQKIKAEIKAGEEKEVAQIHATTLKFVSEIDKQTAQVQAERTRKLGKAESEVTRMVGLAEAEGFKLKVNAFGDQKAYSLYEFTKRLPKDMNLIIAHTGPGTLWTDLDKAMAGELGGMKILRMEERK